MTNFAFFREQAKNSIQIAAHVYLKTKETKFVESISDLLDLSKEDIVCFDGAYLQDHQIFRILTSSKTQPELQTVFAGEDVIPEFFLSTNILDELIYSKIPIKDIEDSVIPKLFAEYSNWCHSMCEKYGGDVEEDLKMWNPAFIDKWRKFHKVDEQQLNIANFEYFRQHAQESGKFAYHILYKDGRFESIKNDLQDLFSIDENDIVFFEGMWGIIGFDRAYRKISSTLPENQRRCGEYIGERKINFYAFGPCLIRDMHRVGVEFSKLKEISEIVFKQYKKEYQNRFTRQKYGKGSRIVLCECLRRLKHNLNFYLEISNKDRLNKALGVDDNEKNYIKQSICKFR
jgi:hypothetical protein